LKKRRQEKSYFDRGEAAFKKRSEKTFIRGEKGGGKGNEPFSQKGRGEKSLSEGTPALKPGSGNLQAIRRAVKRKAMAVV